MTRGKQSNATASAKPTCAAYLRVSTHKQTRAYRERRGLDDSDQSGGVSLEAQVEKLGAWVEQHSLSLDSNHRTLEVESAKTPGDWQVQHGRLQLDFRRGGFADLLQRLKREGGPKILVTQDWDRLARNSLEFFLVRDLIQNHGVEVHTFRNGLVVNDKNWALHSLHLQIREVVASEESAARSSRVRDAIEYKARVLRLFVGNHPPPGYRWKPLEGRRKQIRSLEAIPSQAENIVKLYELVDEGAMNYNELYEWCVAVGLFKAAKKSKARLYKLLRNPVYIGGFVWTPPGEEQQVRELDGNNPPIVTPALWFRVQGILDAKRRTTRKRTTRFHVLEAFLECHLCGERMSPVTPNKKRGDVYWTCKMGACKHLPGVRKGGHQKNIREHMLMEHIAEYLDEHVSFVSSEQALFYKGRLLSPAPGLDGNSARRTELESAVGAAERKIRAARRMLSDDDLDEADYAHAKQRLRKGKEVLARAVSSLRDHDAATPTPARVATAVEMITAATAVGSRWLRLAPRAQRKLLTEILEPPSGTGENARLAIEYDWQHQRVVRLRLRPAWAVIARMAQHAREARANGRATGGSQPPPVSASGDENVDPGLTPENPQPHPSSPLQASLRHLGISRLGTRQLLGLPSSIGRSPGSPGPHDSPPGPPAPPHGPPTPRRPQTPRPRPKRLLVAPRAPEGPRRHPGDPPRTTASRP